MIDHELKRLDPHTSIYMILKKYAKKGKTVDIDLLAQQIGRMTYEIECFLITMEKNGIIHREGRMIGLTEAGMK